MIKVFKENFDWSFLGAGFILSLFMSSIVSLPLDSIGDTSMTTGTGLFFKWSMSFMLFMMVSAVLATYDKSITKYRDRIYEQNKEIEYLKNLLFEKEENLKNEN